MTLSPEFSASVTEYEAETENTTNTVTATGADGVSVGIKVNGSSHTSGQAATWEAGENLVVITAAKAGSAATVYTVTVTKSE